LKDLFLKNMITNNGLSSDYNLFKHGVIYLGESKFFYKVLPIRLFKKEINGYHVLKKYYPVPKLLFSFKDKKNGIIFFEYDKSIDIKPGLLVNLFTGGNLNIKYTQPLLKIYKKNFLKTLKMRSKSSSEIFFDERINYRLKKWYDRSMIESFDGKQYILNNCQLILNLKRNILSIKNYFAKKQNHWSVISQCDPTDLNLGLKPVVFDYTAGGYNPLMAEFATIFWYNLGQGSYLSPIYQKNIFTKYKEIYKHLSKLKIEGEELMYACAPVRYDFLKVYVESVITPCFDQIGKYDNWYEEFRNYFAMKVLCVFDVRCMTKKDLIFSLCMLEYFYNIAPKNPQELLLLTKKLCQF
jgi:hypothetical protein